MSQPSQSHTPAGESAHPWSRHRRILVASADPRKVRDLAMILEPAGYPVTAAGSDAEVLERWDRTAVDLVLADAALPVAGVELCRTLHRNLAAACPPIAVLASHPNTEELVHAYEAGAVDYFPRPFVPEQILARIRVHLRHRVRIDQLSKADVAKNRLLSMAAHDLRNPLASVRALTDFLRDGTVGPLTPQQQALLNTIHVASESMLDLVNELLDIAVLEVRGELALNTEPTSLDELIDISVHLNNLAAARKGSVIVAAGDELPRLTIDGPKIRQVLDNVLNNAVKFSPHGSTVRIEKICQPDRCTIAVRDNGPGIPPGEESKLFTDFGRTSVRPTAGETSTGLGLSISRKIVEAHNGRIEAFNIPGGAEFRITLPLNDAA